MPLKLKFERFAICHKLRLFFMTYGGPHRRVVRTLQTLKKVLKWWGKKDISSNLVWNPLTMSMAMTRGGSKKVTNSTKVG